MTLAMMAGIGAGLGTTLLGAMIGSSMRKHGADDIQYGKVVLVCGLFVGIVVWFLLTVPSSGWGR